MSKLNITIDPQDKHVQIYGKYRYNTQLGQGNCHLSLVSKRKDYPDVISRNRSESCIVDAIENYDKELNEVHAKIRADVAKQFR